MNQNNNKTFGEKLHLQWKNQEEVISGSQLILFVAFWYTLPA
jgi:hypothetical protein